MQQFDRLHGVAAPIDQLNVDTDQIIPARFLLKPRAFDYGAVLFHDVRFGEAADPDFALNLPAYREARIIVGNANFGCGSSREHAAYALADYGVRAVIAPSFGDIFRMNCVKNGVLPAQVPAEVAAGLRRQLHEHPGATMTVDLESQTVTHPDGAVSPFEVDPSHREQLLKGEDDIARTLSHEDAITAFEQGHFADARWALPNKPPGPDARLRP